MQPANIGHTSPFCDTSSVKSAADARFRRRCMRRVGGGGPSKRCRATALLHRPSSGMRLLLVEHVLVSVTAFQRSIPAVGPSKALLLALFCDPS